MERRNNGMVDVGMLAIRKGLLSLPSPPKEQREMDFRAVVTLLKQGVNERNCSS
jgi:hypothetical protein